MTLIESIRKYIVTYPYLSQFAKVNVDYLAANPEEYTIDTVPGDTIVEEDIAGNSVRQLLFVFASREAFGQDYLKNIENSGFYEKFESWLEEQNQNKNFPILEDGKTPIEIKAQGQGYILENDDNTARYQIQCRLLYEQKGVN